MAAGVSLQSEKKHKLHHTATEIRISIATSEKNKKNNRYWLSIETKVSSYVYIACFYNFLSKIRIQNKDNVKKKS